jgi:hypothetical protein
MLGLRLRLRLDRIRTDARRLLRRPPEPTATATTTQDALLYADPADAEVYLQLGIDGYLRHTAARTLARTAGDLLAERASALAACARS